jgi:hypothetical protein
MYIIIIKYLNDVLNVWITMEVTLNNFSRRNYFVKTVKATIHCNAFSVN